MKPRRVYITKTKEPYKTAKMNLTKKVKEAIIRENYKYAYIYGPIGNTLIILLSKEGETEKDAIERMRKTTGKLSETIEKLIFEASRSNEEEHTRAI